MRPRYSIVLGGVAGFGRDALAIGLGYLLVVLGLLISVPIVVWGSTLILRWIERFPVLLYDGAIMPIQAPVRLTSWPIAKMR